MKQVTRNLIMLGLTSFLVLTPGCKKKKKAGVSEYTYNTYLSTNPKTWNVHNWESSDESYIPAFCEMGLYDLAFNEKRDGYVVIHELAGEMPKDVTSSISDADYDKYGYSGNLDKGFVWEIKLNKDAVWENGEAIKAVDYVESMKRQLDPKMVNFRADSYYASTLVLANAERYFKQGRSTIEPLYNYINKDDGSMPDVVCEDGKYYINIARATPFGNAVFTGNDPTDPISLYSVLNNRGTPGSDALELAAQRIQDGCAYFAWKYCNHEGDHQNDWESITDYSKLSSVKEEMMNYEMFIDEFDSKEVYARGTINQSGEEYAVRYTKADLQADLRTVASLAKCTKDFAWKLPLFGSYYNDYSEDFGNVGIAATDEYTIRLYLSQAVSELDLEFSLTGNWLVKVDLYDSLKQVAPSGYVTTKYATPGGGVEGYMSYGPYKLSVYESGKEMRMVRNEKWYGWTDGAHEGMFNATGIYTRIIKDHNVAMQEFEAGNLDDIELNRSDMKIYGNSSRKTAAYESYTQKISFNSDWAKLKSRQSAEKGNKTILSNLKFRTGLSLAMDRNNFAAQATAGSKAFTGLLNDLYLTNVNTGEAYRNTDQGKSVYNMVYGQLGGDPYDSSYTPTALAESENGYNLAMATKFVAEGLQEEANSTVEGHLEANGKIGLEFRVYDTESEATKEMLTFIRSAFSKVIEEANKKLETHYTIEITSQKDEDYYNSAKAGQYDMIFSTWGGAAVNPIGLMQVYCDNTFPSNCEYGFAGKQDSVNVEIDANGNGVIDPNESKTFTAWWTEINTITEDPDQYTSDYENWKKQHDYILNVLAGLEAGYLKRFEAVPLVARASTSLNSFKIENGSKVYINLMGYGGLRYLTFNMDDYDWSQFIKSKEYSADLYKN